ncbi:MAG: EVE domain-containing protein [Bdellovibrionales bacterium]|nr:EVE domain-containing protein [Bdellovibrionales bacterium]
MAEKKIPQFWLMKTEPNVFSFEDLVKAPNRTTCWEGVRNYQARNFMRDTFKNGDQVLIYHSNVAEPAVFGIALVVREGYPDLHALDPKSEYFDEAAKTKGISPWVMVDVKATHRFKNPVYREQLKKEPEVKTMMVLQRGARLSVQPVSNEHFDLIVKLGIPFKV